MVLSSEQKIVIFLHFSISHCYSRPLSQPPSSGPLVHYNGQWLQWSSFVCLCLISQSSLQLLSPFGHLCLVTWAFQKFLTFNKFSPSQGRCLQNLPRLRTSHPLRMLNVTAAETPSMTQRSKGGLSSSFYHSTPFTSLLTNLRIQQLLIIYYLTLYQVRDHTCLLSTIVSLVPGIA